MHGPSEENALHDVASSPARSLFVVCLFPQLNDCTSPVQAGIAGQGPDLLGEAYGVISHR